MSMTPERVAAIFNIARKLPIGEQAYYLDGACAGNALLRQRVEELLHAHEAAGAFLPELETEGAVPGAPQINSVPTVTVREEALAAEGVGTVIGPYKLMEKIGEGGCGVVYVAEQTEPLRRRVALKVIKLGMDTRQVVARFEAERLALAMMDHPNIAKVLDAGTTAQGRPYFVMELVRGIRITDYCDEANLSTRQRLELFIQVCQAIQHAHQKGIIHRDIKPSNILVTLHDGVAVPKVIDFGIAKATEGRLTEATVYTQLHQFIGTPAYMSPEQAEMSGLDIDTRSDIYSLGVLLYELLVGSTPFDTKELMALGLDALRKTIRETEPVRPSTKLATLPGEQLTMTAKRRSVDSSRLVHLLQGDLDWIVMKCLEKDRTRRYETANGLAADLKRHLNNEPVVARPPSKLDRFQKMVRRNKLVFAVVLVVTAWLLLALGVATVAAIRIQRDNRQILKAKNDATEKLRGSYLMEARALRASRRQGQRFASLDAASKAAAIRRDLAVRNEAIACLAVADLRVSKEAILNGHAADGWVCYDYDLQKYAVEGTNGSIVIRAASDDRVLGILPAPGFTVELIRVFSLNSRYLQARYWHDREGERPAWEADWVWDLERQKPVARVLQQEAGSQESPFYLAGNFSADSRFFFSSGLDGTISAYDLGTGEEVKRLSAGRRFSVLIGNPSNTQLACCSEDNSTVEIRDLDSGRMLRALACPWGVSSAAWSDDGRRLATACLDRRIYLWDALTGQRQAALEGHSWTIVNVVFDHAGDLLASSSFEGLVRLWDVATGREVANHPGSSWQLQFSPDDRHLSGLWEINRHATLEVASRQECRLLFVEPSERSGLYYSGPEFSADGQLVAAGSGNQVRFWDAFSGKELGSFLLKGCDTHLFHPDGRSLIVTDRSGGANRRAVQRTGEGASSAYRLGKPTPLFVKPDVVGAALSQDGRYLALALESEGEAVVLDLQNPSIKPVSLRPHRAADRIAISPDGRWVATASWHNSLVKVWDARSADLVRTLQMPGRAQATFSPDGRWLATSSSEYQLWEVGSWLPKGPAMPGHPIFQWNFTAFSPDSRLVARTLDGNKIQLLETLTGKPLATLEAPGLVGIQRFAFSPDGSRVAAVQADQQVRLWDLRLIRQELAQMNLDWDLPPYPPIPAAVAIPAKLEVEPDPASQAPVP